MMRRYQIVAGIAGVSLTAMAALTPSSAIEAALADEGTLELSWGPALFRTVLGFHGLVLLVGALLCKPGLGVRMAGRLFDSETQAMPRGSSRRALLVLSVLSIVALALRLWRLDTCLWLDEILTLDGFARSPLGTVVTSFPNQNQHMLYSVLAHLSLTTFGDSAWALRLPSVFFGVGSVWALYAVGRQIASRGESLMAAALVTVSYHHVWFSQNARGYMGLLFFTLLATWLFVRGLQAVGVKTWIGYAVCVALGLWVHMTMLFVVAGHALVYGWLFVRSLSQGTDRALGVARWVPLAGFVLGATLTVQLYALSLPEFFASALHEVSLPSRWTNPLWVLSETISSMRIGLAGVFGVMAATGLLLAGLGSFARSNRVFVALLILPGLMGGGYMVLAGHNLWPRFFFYTLGFLILIVVRGAHVVGRAGAVVVREPAQRAVWSQRLGTALAGLIVAASALSLPRCYRLPKQDYLGAKAFVESRFQSGDRVVAVGLAALSYGKCYAPAWETAETLAELNALRESSDATWLVYAFPIHMQSYRPEIWEALKADFEVVRVFPGTLSAGEVYVCRNRRPMFDPMEG